MTLTIIIVSYNVKVLLENCLRSVSEAISGVDAEVFIVDNNSTDGSIGYLQPLFPAFRFIVNSINEGFARANNQALKLAGGHFILFLNPDTLIPADSLNKCLNFMAAHPDAGALGVRMVNGEGRYLKESKRGFPTPAVSLWKLTGITAMLPRSAYFARYYLGHLGERQTHQVDVLSGAFMFVRKKVLDLTGGFDEQFFMYAEDIDLSYRIRQAGYHNYYVAETTIVHFKGGSTRKDAKYVKIFYKAMSQYAKKRYGPGPFTMFLNAGIRAREGIELVKKFFKKK